MSTFQEKLKKAGSGLKDKITTGIEHGKRFLQRYKKQVMISGITTTVLLAGSAAGYTYYQSQIKPIYHVYFHNQLLGVVDSPDIVNEWIEKKVHEESSKYAHVKFQTDDNIRFEKEELYKPTFDNEAALSELKEQFSLKASAVRLEIDGEFIGYVPDDLTVSTLLDAIKSDYVSEEFITFVKNTEKSSTKKPRLMVASLTAEENVSTQATSSDQQENNGQAVDIQALEYDKLIMTQARIQQSVDIHPTVVHPSQVLSEEKLKEILQSSTVEEKVYYVQSGDVLGTIAQKHDLTTKELLALNPNIKEDQLLQIDQEIVVMGSEPLISVETIEQVKKIESIPFNTQHKKSDALYQGERRTEKKGKEGKKTVVYEIVKVNGKEIERTSIEEDIITEPEEEVLLVGTKVKPSRGSGKFNWPAVGGKITSGFGNRWGRLHAGIDISGVSDRTIKAADNGKVVKATYNSGYGHYVVVDHGNGYQTLYAHLSSISVSKGDTVKKGDKLGVMGSTGHSTGVHLHFEVIKNGNSVNPIQYLNR